MATDDGVPTIATDVEAGALIGRGQAWVPDPFDAFRGIVGGYASELDDRATLIGEDIADRDDAWLRERASEIGRPLEEISPERAAETLAWDARIAEAEAALRRATENALLIAGSKARKVDGAWLPHATRPDIWRPVGDVSKVPPDGYDAERERIATLIDAATELAERRASAPDGGRYLHAFVPANQARLAESIAIAREQRIGQELRAQRERDLAADEQPGPGDTERDSGDPVLRRKHIGVGDVAALTERRRAAQAQEHPDCHIRRDEVSVVKTSEQLEPRIGLRRSVSLSVGKHPLVAWLEDQPDEWIRTRSAELGQPDADLDFAAARTERRLEAGLLNAFQERDREIEEAGELRYENPEAAAAAEDRADKAEDKAYDIRRKLRPLGARLDAWMSDKVVLATAYADELATRNEIALRQQIELSVLEPPEHITDMIGPASEPGARRRNTWERITRAVERERLSGRFDPHRGTDGQSQTPELPSELNREIDALRADRRMEPRAPAAIAYVDGLTTVRPGELGPGIHANAKTDRLEREILDSRKVMPIEIAHDGFIVDGEHRYRVLCDLGVQEIPAFVGTQAGASGRLQRAYSGLMLPIEIPAPENHYGAHRHTSAASRGREGHDVTSAQPTDHSRGRGGGAGLAPEPPEQEQHDVGLEP